MPSIPLFTFQKSNKKGTYMFKVEAIIDNLNPHFFNAMQDNDYYLTEGADNFIVLEHAKNKSKVAIYETKSGDFFANFKNGLYFEYFKKDILLGDIETLSLSGILEVIHDKNFQDFCNTYKNVTIHKGDCYAVYDDTKEKIKEICDNISDLLIYKNQKYGNSALEPQNIFYKGDTENALLIRLDDKIGRIINNTDGIRINDVCDIIGYLVLYLVFKKVSKKDIERLKD